MRMTMGTPARPLDTVPFPVLLVFATALVAQLWLDGRWGASVAGAGTLPVAPAAPVLALAAAGDRDLAAVAGMLWLQAFDHPPGQSIPFAELDYRRVRAWLERLLALRPEADYPLLAAIRVYAQVPDPRRQRRMIDFVREAFRARPVARWRWQAHAVYVARHRLDDEALALALADELAAGVRGRPEVPAFARQMHVFVRAGLGDLEGARVLLGALLAAGEVSDPNERRFLLRRLKELEAASAGTDPSG